MLVILNNPRVLHLSEIYLPSSRQLLINAKRHKIVYFCSAQKILKLGSVHMEIN